MVYLLTFMYWIALLKKKGGLSDLVLAEHAAYVSLSVAPAYPQFNITSYSEVVSKICMTQ